MRPPCSRVVSLLTDYLDNRLPADVRTDLERHLGGCSECTAFLGTFRSTVSLLQSLSEDDLPEELRLRLRAFLDDRCKS
jgi:anti-sigma factor RsiW